MVKLEGCWPWLERRGLQSTAKCSSAAPEACAVGGYGKCRAIVPRCVPARLGIARLRVNGADSFAREWRAGVDKRENWSLILGRAERRPRRSLLAHRVISLLSGIWSLSGHSGLWQIVRPAELWVRGLGTNLIAIKRRADAMGTDHFHLGVICVDFGMSAACPISG